MSVRRNENLLWWQRKWCIIMPWQVPASVPVELSREDEEAACAGGFCLLAPAEHGPCLDCSGVPSWHALTLTTTCWTGLTDGGSSPLLGEVLHRGQAFTSCPPYDSHEGQEGRSGVFDDITVRAQGGSASSGWVCKPDMAAGWGGKERGTSRCWVPGPLHGDVR